MVFLHESQYATCLTIAMRYMESTYAISYIKRSILYMKIDHKYTIEYTPLKIGLSLLTLNMFALN